MANLPTNPKLCLTQAKWELYTQITTKNQDLLPIIRPYSTNLLLVFLLAFNALVRFNQNLRRFNNLVQLVQVGMVSWPVILLVTGFNNQALLVKSCH